MPRFVSIYKFDENRRNINEGLFWCLRTCPACELTEKHYNSCETNGMLTSRNRSADTDTVLVGEQTDTPAMLYVQRTLRLCG